MLPAAHAEINNKKKILLLYYHLLSKSPACAHCILYMYPAGTLNKQKWTADGLVEPCWGLTQHHRMSWYILPSEWRQAKSRTPRVTFSTYVSRVDGLQAAEDVTKLWGSWLQVREVPRPLGCQGFLTVELPSKGQTRWQWAFGDFIQTGGKLKEIQT